MPELERFGVAAGERGRFRVRIETGAGDVVEFAASRDQLDVMADALDDILAETEEDDAVGDDGPDEEGR